MAEQQLSTLLEILNFSAELLKKKEVPEARLNAELMLAEVLKCSRLHLYMDFEKPLSQGERDKFKAYLKRRLNREPLQYILGKTSFYGYEFKVTPDVLIPRPDTELLVEKVLHDIKESGRDAVNIFEAGAGSGCISISIANELKKQNIDFKIIAIDKSPEAITIARENLNSFDIDSGKVIFRVQDLLQDERMDEDIDYFVSNPPYISVSEFSELEPEVKEYEPRISLTDEGDGLLFYRKILDIYLNTVNKYKIYCEIAYNQRAKLTGLIKSKNIQDYGFYKDYGGNERLLVIKP